MNNRLSLFLPTAASLWDRLRPLSKVMPSLIAHHSQRACPFLERGEQPGPLRWVLPFTRLQEALPEESKGVCFQPPDRQESPQDREGPGNPHSFFTINLELSSWRERGSRVVPGKGLCVNFRLWLLPPRLILLWLRAQFLRTSAAVFLKDQI